MVQCGAARPHRRGGSRVRLTLISCTVCWCAAAFGRALSSESEMQAQALTSAGQAGGVCTVLAAADMRAPAVMCAGRVGQMPQPCHGCENRSGVEQQNATRARPTQPCTAGAPTVPAGANNARPHGSCTVSRPVWGPGPGEHGQPQRTHGDHKEHQPCATPHESVGDADAGVGTWDCGANRSRHPDSFHVGEDCATHQARVRLGWPRWGHRAHAIRHQAPNKLVGA